MTETQAFEQLTDLLGWKGKLKIITAFPDPDRDPSITPIRPSYFILHDVVRLKVNGMKVNAYSEEGDRCGGRPTALLARLTEWSREPKDAVGIPNNGR